MFDKRESWQVELYLEGQKFIVRKVTTLYSREKITRHDTVFARVVTNKSVSQDDYYIGMYVLQLISLHF